MDNNEYSVLLGSTITDNNY